MILYEGWIVLELDIFGVPWWYIIKLACPGTLVPTVLDGCLRTLRYHIQRALVDDWKEHISALAYVKFRWSDRSTRYLRYLDATKVDKLARAWTIHHRRIFFIWTLVLHNNSILRRLFIQWIILDGAALKPAFIFWELTRSKDLLALPIIKLFIYSAKRCLASTNPISQLDMLIL